MGINCTLPSNVKIGDNVMMGPQCFFLAFNHEYKDKSKVFGHKVIRIKKLLASVMMYGSVVKFYSLLAGQ